jgi:MoaA/NifB/PqqE/SkfB family radical SAM enzyme
MPGDWYRRFYQGFHYRLRTFGGGRWASHCRPTDIGFMVTNLCNARCVHCDIWKNKGREDTPSPEQLKCVLTDLRRWLGPVPLFFSGGEALLRPYTVDLVRHASALGLFTEILTHGYWDDQTRIEALALARPSRITISLDALGETHTLIRGREKFFEKTSRTLETLQRVRKENQLKFVLRLKTVIMNQNMDEVHRVAEFAGQNDGMESFYQAIEQNYNTPEDPRWFEHSDNWPRDPERAITAVDRLIAMKQSGLPIANSYAQLEAMKPYFRNPDSARVSIQSHSAHERRAVCSALTNLQIMPNGDVLSCYGMPPVGNIRDTPIREIWEKRPRWWEGGCCLERRCTPSEKATLAVTDIAEAR